MKKNNMQIVGVILKSENHYPESKLLLDMSFNNFHLEKIISKGDYIKTIPIKKSKKGIIKLYAGRDIYFPLRKGERENVEYKNVYNSGSEYYVAKYDVTVNEEKYEYSEELIQKEENRGFTSIFYSLFKKFSKLLGK